jgi:probable HAF family extracellular repeat protein
MEPTSPNNNGCPVGRVCFAGRSSPPSACGMYYVHAFDGQPGGTGSWQVDIAHGPGACGDAYVGPDTFYGIVSHLGTNLGNTVTVLAAGFGSEFTAAGWSDNDAGTFHALRWTLSGGTQDLGTLLGAAGNSVAFGISDDGSTIVGWSNTTPGTFPTGNHAFRWTQGGGMQDLGSLQGSSGTSFAYAANQDGSVVVGVTDMPPNGAVTVPSHAFRWTQAGGMQDLGSLGPGLGSIAYAVSADGSVVVGAAAVAGGGTHAFRWTQAGGMQDLGTVNGLRWVTATSVSGDGNVIVGYADPTVALNGSLGWTLSSNSRPFRWTQATGVQDLNTLLANGGVNMTGVTLTAALGISRRGPSIVGAGTFPDTPSGSITSYWAGYCDAADAAACARLANTHDFNGDGKSDIAWRQTGGSTAAWLMNGGQVLQSGGFGVVPTNWTIVGQRDFNGDGKYDWLWRDANTGTVAIWLLNGLQISQTGGLGAVPSNWTIVGTGDFNGDGKGDLLWRDSNTGTVAIWLLNGLQTLQTGGLGAVPSNWSIAGTADFNSDGMCDILWRDTNTGTVAIWLMNGLQVLQSGGLGAVPSNWTIVGTGDFNGDGKSDILWRDASGNVAIWLMNSAQVLQSGGLGAVPSNWTIAETGDFDGDGKSDILWRDTSGNTAIWFMNGLQVSSSASLGVVTTDWTIQGLNTD